MPWNRFAPLAVFLLSFLVYNANLHVVGSQDSYAARFLPFSIWKAGTLDYEPILDAALQRQIHPYWVFPTKDGRRSSLFPIVTPVLITPLYAPAVGYLQLHDWKQEDLERVALVMDKVSASFITSLAVAIMFLVIRRRLPLGDALLLTASFAFGTSTWSTSSQSLWLHGVAELCGAVALWAITSTPTRTRALIAGAAIALLVSNRPADVFIGAAVGLYAVVWARRAFGWLALGGLVPGGLVLAFNLHTFGHPLGAWGLFFRPEYFKLFSVYEGAAGLLVSPGRGLFLFTPFLLFLPLFINRAFRERQDRLLSALLVIGMCLHVVFLARIDWRGGHSYGPRYLVDLLPFMFWLMVPIIASLNRGQRVVYAALLVFSVSVQYIGAFHYNAVSNDILFKSDDPYDTHNFWALDRLPFVIEARNPISPHEVLWAVRALGDPPPPEMTVKPRPVTFIPLARCTAYDTRGPNPWLLESTTGMRAIPMAGKCGIPDSAASVVGFITTSDAAASGHLFIGPHAGGPFTKIEAGRLPRTIGPVAIPLSRKDGTIQAFATLERKGTLNFRIEVTGYHGYVVAPPLDSAGFRVHWDRQTTPPVVAAGSITHVRVTFTNMGDSVWPDPLTAHPAKTDGTFAVRLAYDWYPAGSDLRVQKNGARVDLPGPLRPGQSVTLDVPLSAPTTRGRFVVVFELVQELIAWFDTKGAEQLEVPVTVN